MRKFNLFPQNNDDNAGKGDYTIAGDTIGNWMCTLLRELVIKTHGILHRGYAPIVMICLIKVRFAAPNFLPGLALWGGVRMLGCAIFN